MSEPLLIEALFAPGCDSRNETLSLINKVTDQLNVKFQLREVIVKSTDEAVEEHFLGSPSIHINGDDIDPDSLLKEK